MSTNTEKLNLFKYETEKDGKQTFNIERALNENWDKIDAFASTKGVAGGLASLDKQGKVPEEQLPEMKNGTSLPLFSSVIQDHILTCEESKGYALQGTWVYKNSAPERYGYPDFYNKCLEEYENSASIWQQPVAIADTTPITGGNMVITASSVSTGWDAYKGFNNIATSVDTGWALNGVNKAGWWQVKLPYKIRITGLKYYRRYSQNADNATTGRFYTSSNKTVALGEAFSVPVGANSQYSLDVSNIPAEGVITDTIYLETQAIAGSYGGMDYLEIAATEIIRKNANGHQFYNISDKEVIDELFEQKGVAWYYGVDEENERIFLPRNNKFIQCTTDTSKVNEFNEAGLPNIEASAGTLATGSTAEGTGAIRLNATGNCTLGNSGGSKYQSLTFNASDSNEIYGSSDTVQPPSVSQLLYIVVGNTEQTQAITDVTEITTSENDTIPLFTGEYFDFKPNNISWLKAGVQQNSGGIYASCYNELVNELTNPKYGLKVVEGSKMISGVDYSEYWKINQDEMYFITPNVSKSGIIAEESTAQLYFKVANAVENLQLLDAGKVLESLADKVDKDSDLFNGQWVFNPILLTNSTAADQALDLSNYLPEDGYNYEVMLSCQSYSRETEYNRWIYTDIMPVSSPAWTDLWCNTNTRHSTNSFIVPVGTGRVIYIGGSGMNILEIFAKGYRRLGAIKQ